MKSKYLRLLRPIAWITFLLPFSVGFGLGIKPDSSIFLIFLAFIVFCCWMSFCFIINTIGDIEVDKFHDGRSKDMNLSYQPLVTNEITKKEAIRLGIIFLFFSLLIAWFINLLFFIIILIVDIVGYIYSMPPLRLKTRPISDVICNSFAAGAIFMAGLSIGGQNMEYIIIIGSFLMAAIFYIPTVVSDYEFDKKAGLKTSAVFFGPKKIMQLMYLFNIVLVILMIILFIISNFELRVLSILIIIYSTIFTFISNIKLKKERLYLHEFWILIPFSIISLGFILYGVLKLVGFINL